MIVNSKCFQSLDSNQSAGNSCKVEANSSSPLRLRYTTAKFNQSKRYTLSKLNNNFISNQNKKSTLTQPPPSQSNFFDNPSYNLRQSRNQEQTQLNTNQKKQSFRNFIEKIQIYNQNTLIKQSSNFSHLHSHKKQSSNLQEQQEKNNFLNVSIKDSFQSEQVQPQDNIDTNKKVQNSTQNNQKPRNFIIHDTMGKGFFTRGCRRSKTQQEIKINKIDFQINRKSRQTHIRKDFSSESSIFQRTVSKLKMRNDSTPPLKYIDIKLVGREISAEQGFESKQSLQNNTSQESVAQQVKNSQKEAQIQKRNIETKYSKIRIRFGSSLYNKNLLTIQSPNGSSKQQFKIESQNILIELGTIHNKKSFKTTSMNSQFCQNKIIEAQNNFIQKRRLLPTAETKTRGEDLVKTKKEFFSISNPIIKHKKLEKHQIEINKNLPKGEKLNGWEMNQDGLSQYKIEELF